MQCPVTNKVNTIFVHVSNLEKSVKWYADLLGLDYDTAAIKRPVYNINIAGHTGLTLDAGPEGVTKIQPPCAYPLFNFHTENIADAYSHVKELGYQIEADIVSYDDFSFFTIRDPDNHVIMICTG
jgi:predicted enzyme related to lactoylglutathione lyase